MSTSSGRWRPRVRSDRVLTDRIVTRVRLISPLFPDILSASARVLAILHGGQLHVDVLRGTSLAHGAGGGVRQRRVRDALVLRHRLGYASRANGRVRLVEELFPRHRAVSRPGLKCYTLNRLKLC